MNVTQPAVSKSIRLLERSLGVRLLDRNQEGVRPTVFGEKLLGYAQLIASLADEAKDENDALRGARRGKLNVGGVPAALRGIVSSAIVSYSAKHPNVEMFVMEGLTDLLLTCVGSGVLDLVVVPQPTGLDGLELHCEVLIEEPMEIVGGPDHPLARADEVELTDLVTYRWIVPPRPEPDRLRLDSLFVNAGLDRPRIFAESSSLVFLDAMLPTGPYLSYHPRGSLRAAPAMAQIVPIRLTRPCWIRRTCAVTRRKGVLRPTVSAFVSELRAACANHITS